MIILIYIYIYIVCGCGDDLLTGNDYRATTLIHNPHIRTLHTAPPAGDNNETDTGAVNHSNEINEEEHYMGGNNCFYNCGYHYRGSLVDVDIIAIHPALDNTRDSISSPSSPSSSSSSSS